MTLLSSDPDLFSSNTDSLAPELPENQQPGHIRSLEKSGPAPSLGSTIGAAFDVGSDVSAAKNWFSVAATSNEPVEGYNALDNLREQDEPFAERFAGIRNPERTKEVQDQIDSQLRSKGILDSAPLYHTIPALIGAGVLSPISLISVGGGVAGTIAKTGLGVSRVGRFATGVVETLPGAFVGSAASEAVQYAGNVTHTGEETASGIIAGTTFGSLLGGGLAALPSTSRLVGAHIYEKALKGEDFDVHINENGTATVLRSAGSAEAKNYEDVALAHLNEKLAKGISGYGMDFMTSPVVRGLTSPFQTMRLLTDRMFMHNFRTTSEVKGVGTAQRAEELMKWDDAKLVRLNKSNREEYLNYTGQGKVASALFRTEGKMDLDTWNARVSHAMRHPDPEFKDEIPGINKAAKRNRDHLDEISEKLKELGILDKNLSPELSRTYLSRRYNTTYMYSKEGEAHFLKVVSRWYQKHHQDGSLRDKEIPLKGDPDGIEGNSPWQSANDTLHKIRGNSGEVSIHTGAGTKSAGGPKAAFLKERALLMPDHELEPFLMNDAETLVSSYSRKSSALIRTHEQLQSMGYDNVDELIAAMRIEQQQKLHLASDSERAKLGKQLAKDEKLARDVYDLMTGQFYKRGWYERMTDTLLNYQFTRLLGGVSLSSMGEIFMAPFRVGFLNTLRYGYLPMLRNMKMSSLAKDEWKDIDVGLEAETSKFLRSLVHNEPDLNKVENTYDRTINSIVEVYGKATGLPLWTSFGRRLGAQVSSSKLIKTLQELKKRPATPKEVEELAHLGIGVDQLKSVIEAVTGPNGAKKAGGSWFSNHLDWEDKQAANLFKTAVQRQVEGIIIRPSKGDIPLWAQGSAVGKLVFQFSSFGAAATNKILMSALQRRDKDALIGIIGLLTVNMMSQSIKDIVAGREPNQDMGQMFLRAISGSGLLGLMSTKVFDTVSTVFNYGRYSKDRYYSSLIGPTGATGAELVDFMYKLSDGNITDNDVKAGERLIPFVNLFYIQFMMNNVFGDEEL